MQELGFEISDMGLMIYDLGCKMFRERFVIYGMGLSVKDSRHSV
jgi:hypothetical protein